MKSLCCVAVLLTCATAPAATLSVCTSMPACDYSDLQAALNAANSGDVIELRAGDTFTTDKGFILPAKSGDDFITIRSSRWQELPPDGYRVDASHSELMPKLVGSSVMSFGVLRTAPMYYSYALNVDADTFRVSSNPFNDGTPVTFNDPTPTGIDPTKVYYVTGRNGDTFRIAESPDGTPVDITAAPASLTWSFIMPVVSAHHYIIDGLEVMPANGLFLYYLVTIGNPYVTVADQVPHDMQLKRMYVHGRQGQNGPRHCVFLGGTDIRMADSRIAECKDLDADATAILSANGLGRYHFENNYFEGATENVIFGGVYTSIHGTQTSDVVFKRNYFRKKLEWRWWMRPTFVDAQTLKFTERTSNSPCSEQKPCYLYSARDETRYEWKNDVTLTSPNGSGNILIYMTADGVLTAQYGPAATFQGLVCSEGIQCVQAEGVPTWPSEPTTRLYTWGVKDSAFAALGSRQTFIQKVLFEIKQGRNMLLEGNVFDNQWTSDLGTYCAVVLTPRTENGTVPQAVSEAVEFRNNRFRNMSCGITMTGSDTQFGFGGNIRFINNVFDTVSYLRHGINATQGMWFRGGYAFKNVELIHNTVTEIDGPLVSFIDDLNKPPNELLVRSNLAIPRESRDGDTLRPFPQVLGTSTAGWNSAKSTFNPNGVFERNVILNRNGYSNEISLRSQYPVDNNYLMLPSQTLASVGFLDYLNGNYRLCRSGMPNCGTTSDFSAAATTPLSTTGRDIGADIDEVDALTGGVTEGIPSFGARAGVRVSVDGATAQLFYTPPDDSACEIQVYDSSLYARLVPDVDATRAQGANLDSRPSTVVNGRERAFIVGANSPLPPGSRYYYKLICGKNVAVGSFDVF